MKNYIQLISALLICFIFVGITDATAQRSKKKKKKKTDATDEYFDDRGNFAQNLWYGADVSLNFSQAQLGSFPGNVVAFGFSPLVGYKVTEEFSVGPRLEMLNISGRFDLNNNTSEDLKYNSLNLGLGGFMRYKIFQAYFLHAEFTAKNIEDAVGIDTGTNTVITDRAWENHPYLGAGYAPTLGGNFGFHIYVLWDFGREFNSGANGIPIDYRFGINFKF